MSQQFHYTHQRLLVLGIPQNRWLDVVADLKRMTMSAGWVELIEAGNTFKNAGPTTRQFVQWWPNRPAGEIYNVKLQNALGVGPVNAAPRCIRMVSLSFLRVWFLRSQCVNANFLLAQITTILLNE